MEQTNFLKQQDFHRNFTSDNSTSCQSVTYIYKAPLESTILKVSISLQDEVASTTYFSSRGKDQCSSSRSSRHNDTTVNWKIQVFYCFFFKTVSILALWRSPQSLGMQPMLTAREWGESWWRSTRRRRTQPWSTRATREISRGGESTSGWG